MGWPLGLSRAGIGGRPPLAGPTPAMLVILHAAETLAAAEPSSPPSIGAIATATGRTTSYVSRVRQRLREWGLWPWPDAPRGARTKKVKKGDNRPTIADRVVAAAKKLDGRTAPITYAALAKETGLPRQTVERAVKRLERKGLWMWPLVAESGGGVTQRKVKEWVPTEAEIAVACRAILTETIGFPVEEVDQRMVERMTRYQVTV